jgi:Serine aminopeptidase, S33
MSGCCCCCPPAVNALFCLWIQSGCRTGQVAGALTFFPPEPALYQMERIAADGRHLADDEEACIPQNEEADAMIGTNGGDPSDHPGDDDDAAPFEEVVMERKKGGAQDNKKKTTQQQRRQSEEPLTVETKGQTKKKLKSPVQQLTDQAAERRKRAKIRNARDAADAIAGVTYKVVLDRRLQPPPYDESCLQAVKIPTMAPKIVKKSTTMAAGSGGGKKTGAAATLSSCCTGGGATTSSSPSSSPTKGTDPPKRTNNKASSPSSPPSTGATSTTTTKTTYPSSCSFVATLIYRVPPDRRTPNTKTIIYSHGNATDIGAMFPMQVILAHSLDAHVVMYDYSGYGESGGVPEEAYTYQDIQAVYDYVLEHVAEGGRAENVILYGQSVGSGPCCWLASKDDQVGGMILHSPFTSGMRVLTPSRYVIVFTSCSLKKNIQH